LAGFIPAYLVFWQKERRKMTEDHSEDELVTVEYVAQKLGVDGTTVRRWIKMGIVSYIELPHVGKRSTFRFRRADLSNIMTPKKGKEKK